MDFIFDFETLSQNVINCPVVDCSFLFFDRARFLSDKPYTFQELVSLATRVKFDVAHQVKQFGLVIQQSTLDWWKSQGPEARSKLKPTKDDVTLEDFLKLLLTSLRNSGKIDKFWSRSNSFDPIILQVIMQKVGGDYEKQITDILKWWNVRDTRTYIDALTNFSLKKNAFIPMDDEEKWKSLFVEHDSSHDIAADILRLQVLTRMNANLNME
jgi:hypothetical protein